MRYFIAVLVAGIICACSATTPVIQREFVNIKVPVVTKVKVPAEILAKVQVDVPEFLSPSDKAASSCLSVEGEKRLRTIIITYKNRWDALKAWNDSE